MLNVWLYEFASRLLRNIYGYIRTSFKSNQIPILFFKEVMGGFIVPFGRRFRMR